MKENKKKEKEEKRKKEKKRIEEIIEYMSEVGSGRMAWVTSIGGIFDREEQRGVGGVFNLFFAT